MTAWWLGGLLTVSIILLPWPWLSARTAEVSHQLGARLLAMCPASYQPALRARPNIEHHLLIVLALIVLSLLILGQGSLLGALVGLLTTLGVWLPIGRTITAKRQHQARLLTALPAQLDVLAMLLSAGQPLLSSFEQASRGATPTALQTELLWVVGQVRAGEPLQRAIQSLAERNPSREVRLFCHALQHARESGAGLADILQQQAEQRRQELFLMAERRAMEAPVKMMFPLLIFIFPATILVLGVVLAAKIMWGT